MPKELSRLFKTKYDEKGVEKAEKILGHVEELFAIVAVTPHRAGLEQKKPYIFEVAVKGGDTQKQFVYLKELLGKEVKIDQVFQKGAEVDVAAITKGKGFEDYIIIRGSIPGPYRRLVKIRDPIRPKLTKATQPKILEIML